ncbi:SDR family NAD(P)-dependent oxidoreductase [Companilactobacillus formosensis]|uniref:SDR family NAD(P)-dependent oxidoreductase n=1 Tax=Companilactobacillus formosensis TaxID=1617889 RepID=UPI000E6527CB|nr:SDR family NAD(P)-dependent oxidoreductase [Companilactobacillus formosensis]
MTKTLILIGAGEGLGNSVAKEFAQHDFRIALISRSQKHLDQYAQEFQSQGIETYTHTGDALYPETLTEAINDVIKKWGTPDALVYNIGITTPDGDQKVDSEFLMKRYQIDAASAWHAAQVVSTQEFADKKGAIIFTGGGFAKTFEPIMNLKALCIDKAALNAMNIVLHEELKPRGIFVGSVIVNGAIQKGDSKNDPSLIAKEYWKMYRDRNEYQLLY